MEINYFRHLDYRSLKKRTWKELGYKYNQYDLEYYKDVPSESPILNFPPQPEEVEIFPYTQEEIEYIEERISYIFPKAFKELLHLFGGYIFTNLNIGNKAHENYSIENDISSIKHMQEILKRKSSVKKENQENLFLISYNDYFKRCIITNKFENPPVYQEFDDNKFHIISKSFTNYINNNNLNFLEDVYSKFFTHYTTGRARNLLLEHFTKDKELINKNISISHHSSGILFNINSKHSILIMIYQEELPLLPYKGIIHLMKYNTKSPIKRLYTYSWEKIIFDFNKVTKEILGYLQEY